ncbi:hypothetical protein PR202_ga18178 [Eleusine coracana subsp. coracana]|uniref:DUF659 domain-containing protein n=1 Tax=Eleusine coracana subsp. coracana TaxID=191504 RepID=A0AAV5CSG1_ELECO|nr:hypothetical protein PR202_ga18178 [Eleusine coracana subsp. coracana]
MPTGPAPCGGNSNSKKKRGPASALEKAWAMQDRKHLDALIARSFYSGGIPFNFARNPYLREAFCFAASRSLPGYQMPGCNKLRERLLCEERGHIDTLLTKTKGIWQSKGVTICADGWTDPQRADNCEGQVKTKEYIADKLKSIIEDVGRHNVVQVIADNAANCKGGQKAIIPFIASLIHSTQGILEVANLSLDEPELQAVSFGDVEVQNEENVPVEVNDDEEA